MTNRRIWQNVLWLGGFLLAGSVWATGPQQMNYQGRLSDASGNPVPNGTRAMTFKIYSVPTGTGAGDTQWTETQPSVMVTNGVFNVVLGKTIPLAPNLFQNSVDRYLEVTVGTDVLVPRQKLVASPYALSVAAGSITEADLEASLKNKVNSTVTSVAANIVSTGSFQNGAYTFPGTLNVTTALNVPTTFTLPAAKVAAGSFGTATSDYTFPRDLSVNRTLTAQNLTVTGTLTAPTNFTIFSLAAGSVTAGSFGTATSDYTFQRDLNVNRNLRVYGTFTTPNIFPEAYNTTVALAVRPSTTGQKTFGILENGNIAGFNEPTLDNHSWVLGNEFSRLPALTLTGVPGVDPALYLDTAKIYRKSQGGVGFLGLSSPNGSYTLAVQDDGNVVLTNGIPGTGPAKWNLWGSNSTWWTHLQKTQIDGDLIVNGEAFKTVAGGFTSTSDMRLKKNIQPLGPTLEKLLELKGVYFEYKDPARMGKYKGPLMGFIAQDVEKVFPDWVSTGPDGYKYLGIQGFEALTVEAMRELKKENDGLRDELKDLRSRLTALENQRK